MSKTVNVGLIGYKFMGKAHSQGFRDVGHFFPDARALPVMKVICGRDVDGVQEAQKQFGWQEYETDWRKLIARDDIDLVDISTGNNVHAEMAVAAAEKGKHIFCEKPLAMNVREARAMVDAVKKAGVVNMVNFNYRAVPAIRFARQLIEEGAIGRVFHWRGFYLQDWIIDPDFPLVWRLEGDIAGSGSHGDLAAHSIDLAHYLVGDIDEVVGLQETFVKQRPKLAKTTGGLTAEASTEMGEVTVDDASLFLARFKNGAVGTFEATRFAGHAVRRGSPQRKHVRDQRGQGLHPLQRGADERTGVLQSLRPRRPPGVPRHRDDGRVASVDGRLVAAGAYHRLGTDVHPPDLRTYERHRRREEGSG